MDVRPTIESHDAAPYSSDNSRLHLVVPKSLANLAVTQNIGGEEQGDCDGTSKSL